MAGRKRRRNIGSGGEIVVEGEIVDVYDVIVDIYDVKEALTASLDVLKRELTYEPDLFDPDVATDVRAARRKIGEALRLLSGFMD